MDTAIQQQTDSNGQMIVTPTERQALIQKLYEENFLLSFLIWVYLDSRNGHWNYQHELKIKHMKNHVELK